MPPFAHGLLVKFKGILQGIIQFAWHAADLTWQMLMFLKVS
jgi:hypothetical protein